MNDLAFGTTLLASFAAQIAAVIIECMSPVPALRPAAAIAASGAAPVQVAQAAGATCPRLALAPVAVR